MKEVVEGDLFEQDARNKLNLKSEVGKYLRHWYLFAAGVAICLIAAFFHLRYATTQYYVGTTILIKDQKEGSASIATSGLSEMGVLQPTKKIDDEIVVLKSRGLMERVLRELSLNTSYFLEGRVQDMEVYEEDLPLKIIINELRPSAYSKELVIFPKDDNTFQLGEADEEGRASRFNYRFGQRIDKPYGVFTVVQRSDSVSVRMSKKVIIRFQDIDRIAGVYSNRLSITPASKGSNVLNIGLVDPVWKRGVDILNKLIEVYKSEAVEDKNMIASNALSFIDERLRYLTAELTDVEKNVEQYKKQNSLTDVSSDAALYLRSAEDYNKKLAEYDIQIDLLRSLEDYLKVKEGNQAELVPSSLNIQDPSLLVLISKFNELQLERQRMQKTTNPGNPLMVNINEQVNNLRINIGENIKNLIQGLIITRQNLVANSAVFERRKRMVPAMERELLEINRQQGVKEGLYLYLLQKREESALSLAATVSTFRVIDPPAVLYPIETNKPLVYAIAVLLGIAIPFVFLYLRFFFNDQVLDMRDIAQLTDAPVLGEIARSKSTDSLVVMPNATSPIVEMFRLIRVNLQFAALGKENRVILVTSSISGEGKSFFSLNFAASLVLTGKRVVVLGMDLRKATLSRAVKLQDALGITNFLVSDSVTVDDIVKPSNVLLNLFVVGSGPVSPSPTELMMVPRMGELINTLRASFDYIIIDSAPIGLVADAFTLAPYIDSTIYMVRRNYTPKEKLAIIQKVYREKKLKFPMIVLNDVLIGKGQNYGYGYGKTRSSKPKATTPSRRKEKVASSNDVVAMK